MEVKLKGVQRNGLGVLGNIEVNDDSTIEGELGEVGLQSQVIVLRHNVGREELPSGHVERTRALSCAGVPAHVVSSVRAVTDCILVDQGRSSAATDWGLVAS